MAKVGGGGISDQTYISVGLLIPLIGGIIWLTSIHTLASQAQEDSAKATTEISTIKEANEEMFREILQRLARIEGQVDAVHTEMVKTRRGR